MDIIKVTTDKVNNVKLIRQHQKLGQIILWSVWKKFDGVEMLIGYVYQINNPFFTRRIGRLEYRIKEWLFASFNGMGSARTRLEVITKLIEKTCPQNETV